MGSIVNDDRSQATWDYEERLWDECSSAHPDWTCDQVIDWVWAEKRRRREAATARKDERQANTLFGDIRKS